jgi:hypothetical protein
VGSKVGLDDRAAAELTRVQVDLEEARAEANESEATRIEAEGEREKDEAEAYVIRLLGEEAARDSRFVRRMAALSVWQALFLGVVLGWVSQGLVLGGIVVVWVVRNG